MAFFPTNRETAAAIVTVLNANTTQFSGGTWSAVQDGDKVILQLRNDAGVGAGQRQVELHVQ